MAVARTWSVALSGSEGTVIEVEADISSQLPALIIIGLADRSLGEAGGRVRQAARNSGCSLSSQRLTVNLSPASLPKHGSAFDLAIALACFAADGVVSRESIDDTVHLGELGLDGRLRPIFGVLPAVLAAARAGRVRVMVPAANLAEAQLVPGMNAVGVTCLRDAAIFHGAPLAPEPVEAIPFVGRAAPPTDTPELGRVAGQDVPVQSLLMAAAGGHHIYFLGPPGAGKTMLAHCLPGIMPDLSVDEALDVMSVRSLGGEAVGPDLLVRPPFEAPHHGASAAAILGGGSGTIRPGLAARATGGVLFLDEALEFPGVVLDALRQPLESGQLTIHRSGVMAQFPARFQLVLAANPCPCGQFGSRDGSCTCPPSTVRRYQQRLSGPLLDRVDLRVRVDRVSASALHASGGDRLSTAEARERVAAARQRSAERLAGTPWVLNARVPGEWLRDPAHRLPARLCSNLDDALERGSLSMRGYDRVLRVAWTLADLDGTALPTAEHLGLAAFMRQGAQA